MFNFLTYVLILINNKNITLYELLIKFFLEISNITFKANNPELLQVKLQWFIDSLLAQQSNTGHILLDSLLKELEKYPQKEEIITLLINIIEEKTIEGYTLPFTSAEELIAYSEKTYGHLFKILAIIFTNNTTALNSQEIVKLGSLYGLCEVINLSSILNKNNKYYLCYSLADIETNLAEANANNIQIIVDYINIESKKLRKLYSTDKKLKVFQKLVLYSVSKYLSIFNKKNFIYTNIYNKYFYFKSYLIYLFN